MLQMWIGFNHATAHITRSTLHKVELESISGPTNAWGRFQLGEKQSYPIFRYWSDHSQLALSLKGHRPQSSSPFFRGRLHAINLWIWFLG